jgi:hypothetical protein
MDRVCMLGRAIHPVSWPSPSLLFVGSHPTIVFFLILLFF